MSELAATAVELPNGTEFGVLPVSTSEDVTPDVVTSIIRIMGAAYAAQFEPNHLSRGAVAEHLFDPANEDHFKRQYQRMIAAIETQGAVYWLGRPGAAQHEGMRPRPYVAVAKTTPSRRLSAAVLPKTVQRWFPDRHMRPNLFFDDLAVMPGWQSSQAALLPENRPHVGVTMVHSVLDAEIARGRDGRLITDVARGSGLRPRVTDLQLEREMQHVPPLQVGTETLDYDRYAAPSGVSLAAIRAQLQVRYPHLQSARLV